jgi:hypothetical protein
VALHVARLRGLWMTTSSGRLRQGSWGLRTWASPTADKPSEVALGMIKVIPEGVRRMSCSHRDLGWQPG